MVCRCRGIVTPQAKDEDQPEMQEIALESATRVMDAVQQEGVTMLMTELQGPMQDTGGCQTAAGMNNGYALKQWHLRKSRQSRASNAGVGR